MKNSLNKNIFGGGGTLSTPNKGFAHINMFRKSNLGFTLAEMMVVMLILSIIMAAMAPVMTTRNKLDQSSPWVWADNGSDAYYGIGNAQIAMIGQAKALDTDTGARLLINTAGTKDHILFKSNEDVVGRLRMVNKGILLGTTTTTPGSNSTGVGADIKVSGDTSTAYGYKSSATGAVSIALGSQSQSSEQASIAIGNKAKSSGMTSIAIGSTLPINNTSTTASGNNSIAIGDSSEATNTSSTAIGSQAKALEKNTSAIGAQSQANAERSTAIGFNAMAYGKYSVALGGFPTANEEGTIAIGYSSQASGNSGVAIGNAANATGNAGISIGGNSTASGLHSIALGGLSESSTATSQAQGDYSIAIGHNSYAAGSSSIAIGSIGQYAFTTQARGNNSISIGTWGIASESSAIAVGYSAKAAGESSIAIGDGAKAAGTNNIAIGANACKYATGNNVTCIGANSDPYKDSPTSSLNNVIYLGNTATTVYIPGRLVVGRQVLLNLLGGAVALRRANGRDLAVVRSDNMDGDDDNLRPYLNNKDLGAEKGEIGWYDKWYSLFYSDRRLKYVGKESTSGLDKIRQLKVFNYTFKKDDKKTPHVGVIAQDLQKVFPNAVSKAKDGFLKIRFEDMFYAMINAIKELDTRILVLEKENQQLKETIKQIQNDNKKQEARLKALEAKIK